jgi:hypothetical protein
MNKARRHELKMLKYKKRLKNYGLTNTVGKFYCFRSHGKPCSCWCCHAEKMKVNWKKKKEYKELQFELAA